MKFVQTAERVSHKDISDNYVSQLSILEYSEAAKLVSGKVLEIGTGSGYGIELIASQATKFITLDKSEPEAISKKQMIQHENVEFIKMKVPPLNNISDNSFDFVITFHVIEHIENDKFFVDEIFRVLKNKGKLIVTTPNKKMSLTRNPWHVREYTVSELENLLLKNFQSVRKLGVFGKKAIMEYYYKNKASVGKISRFDFFNLQYRLPRWLLKIPYDILNRWNRKKILRNNSILVSEISMSDYYLDKANDECFALFYIAKKMTASDK